MDAMVGLLLSLTPWPPLPVAGARGKTLGCIAPGTRSLGTPPGEMLSWTM